MGKVLSRHSGRFGELMFKRGYSFPCAELIVEVTWSPLSYRNSYLIGSSSHLHWKHRMLNLSIIVPWRGLLWKYRYCFLSKYYFLKISYFYFKSWENQSKISSNIVSWTSTPPCQIHFVNDLKSTIRMLKFLIPRSKCNSILFYFVFHFTKLRRTLQTRAFL